MEPQVVRLTCPETAATAAIAVSHGFNCFSWRAPLGGKPRELLWAEEDFPTRESRASRSGVPLLVPFPGRIAGGVFEWDGQRYDLEKTGGDHAIHGFALRAPWRVLDHTDSSVTAEFLPSVDSPDAVGQWPADYRVTGTYALVGGALVLDLTVENVGDKPMPLAFGTHAYFRLPLADGSDPEATVVRTEVDGEWRCDGMIPTGDVDPVPADHALNTGAPLAGREFDSPYRFAGGASVTELVDPESGARVRQTFDDSMRCCVIYTPGHREAICLEPYTCVPDPIALESRGVATGLRTLAPGETYETRVTLEALTE